MTVGEGMAQELNAVPLRREIEEKLRALGGTTVEVAASLETKGVRGKKGSACLCPIAMYLKWQISTAAHYHVSPGRISAYQGGGAPPVEVPLMYPFPHFIGMFDQGLFPQLEELPSAPGTTQDDHQGPSKG